MGHLNLNNQHWANVCKEMGHLKHINQQNKNFTKFDSSILVSTMFMACKEWKWQTSMDYTQYTQSNWLNTKD